MNTTDNTYCAEGLSWLDALDARPDPRRQSVPLSRLNRHSAFADALSRYRNARPEHDAATAARYRAARISIARTATRWGRRTLFNQLGDHYNALFGKHSGSQRRHDAPPVIIYISG
jgi:hypothetical protein